MITDLKQMIQPAYQCGTLIDQFLVLEEQENLSKPGTLPEVRLFLRDVAQCAAYKFDQIVSIDQIQHETYAPFLTAEKGLRSMCDFIVFYTLRREPEVLHTWLVNLKSSRVGNSAAQLQAGYHLAQFLRGKLGDHAASPWRLGQLDYVLFSLVPQKAQTDNRLPDPAATHTSPAQPYHLNRARSVKLGPLVA